jgi:hypothetical protein
VLLVELNPRATANSKSGPAFVNASAFLKSQSEICFSLCAFSKGGPQFAFPVGFLKSGPPFRKAGAFVSGAELPATFPVSPDITA